MCLAGAHVNSRKMQVHSKMLNEQPFQTIFEPATERDQRLSVLAVARLAGAHVDGREVVLDRHADLGTHVLFHLRRERDGELVLVSLKILIVLNLRDKSSTYLKVF